MPTNTSPWARGMRSGVRNSSASRCMGAGCSPLAQAYEMVLSGEIKDAKTVAGILKFKAMLDDKKI